MRLRHLYLAGALALASPVLLLGGCGTIQSWLGGPITPDQVTTLGTALQATSIVQNSTTVAVNNITLSRSVLVEINADNEAVHAALKSLEADQASGKPLDFVLFRAAYAAFLAHAAANNVTVRS